MRKNIVRHILKTTTECVVRRQSILMLSPDDVTKDCVWETWRHSTLITSTLTLISCFLSQKPTSKLMFDGYKIAAHTFVLSLKNSFYAQHNYTWKRQLQQRTLNSKSLEQMTSWLLWNKQDWQTERNSLARLEKRSFERLSDDTRSKLLRSKPRPRHSIGTTTNIPASIRPSIMWHIFFFWQSGSNFKGFPDGSLTKSRF